MNERADSAIEDVSLATPVVPPAERQAVSRSSSGEGLDNLRDFFAWRCQQQPDALAYAFLRDTLEIADSLTYAELDAQVRTLAGEVARHSQPGDRVLLVYPPGLEVVRAFWACMLTGRIAVPLPAPDPARFKNNAPRLRAVMVDARASLILTNEGLLDSAQEFRNEEGAGGARWVASDAPRDTGLTPIEWAPVDLWPDSVAYLQYTSGSTATPRGVIITHANVLAQCRSIASAFGVSAESSRVLSWLPHFHDYGLVFGLLMPFHAGIPTYAMSPLTFLRRPLRWLEGIARYAATHTGAPNFAYVACLKALEQQADWQADLSRLVSCGCGAEPIHPETGEKFHAAFAAHGLPTASFAPAYGMAETVLGVTATRYGSPARVLSLDGEALARQEVRPADALTAQRRAVVGCGEVFDEMQLRIVDPHTLEPCESGRVGEIWVRGSSVGHGYWGREQVSAEIFEARTASGEGPFLRTGDLGFILEEQLYVTGRLKDLIIIHGRNHAPQDIEWTVQRSSPDLRAGYGAAFSIDTDDGEAVVVVQEVERSAADADLTPLLLGIRRALALEHDLPVHSVVLIRAGSVARTTSGKIRRQACKQQFLDGALQILQSDVSTAVEAEPLASEDVAANLRSMTDAAQRLEATKRVVVDLVARFARRRPQDVSLDASAVECGLDSLSTFRLIQEVESRLGIELPQARVLGEPHLRWMVGLIAERVMQPSVRQPLVALLSSTERQRLLPLSAAQQRMWFWQEMAPQSALYNVAFTLKWPGPLNVQALQDSLFGLVQRHEALRTRWVAGDGQHGQRIEPMHDWRMRHQVLDRDGPVSPMEQYEALAAHEAAQPVDLTVEPAMRATLVSLDAADHRLIWTLHHSVCDGWSIGVLIAELCELYDARVKGLPKELPKLAFHFLDFTAWQSKWLADGRRDRELAYWTQKLSDAPPSLQLPTDHRRPVRQRFHGSSVAFRLAEVEVQALRALAQRTNTTLFMTLLAAWQSLLHRYSGQSSIVTGSIIANRERREFTGVVGFFANTLAMRSDFEVGLTVEGLLAQIKATALEAYEHQHVPFEEVVEALQLPRDLSRKQLIQTFIVLQPASPTGPRFGDAIASIETLPSTVAKFDLSLELQESGTELLGCLEYDTDLFERASIERLAQHLRTLVAGMCADSSRPVAELGLMDSSERKQILSDWNATSRPYALDVGMHVLVEQQAERTPSAVAAAFFDQRISYAELNTRSNRLAHHLRRLGVAPDVRVGVCMERSIEIVVGLLAVLKAGGAFVPMDPELPRERLAHIMDDTSAPVVLTQSHLLDRIPRSESDSSPRLLPLDTLLDELPHHDQNRLCLTGPEHLAYVIYTSGSTGRPKGVMIPHRALCNSTLWSNEAMNVTPSDRLLQKTTIGFDAAISEFFISLQSGATLVLAAPGEHRDTAYLVRAMRDERITMIAVVPSLLRQLLEEPGLEDCVHLRYVMSGGEALTLELAGKFQRRLPHATLGNFYGPSETTIDSTHCVAIGDFGACATVPIGRPIANTQCYVLDDQRQPVPAGVVGELYIGGAGVARGYLNLPDSTEQRFVAHPFAPGQRVYRTGDLVRWLRNGHLEYLGRNDFQVKIRGQRIELGEVEAILNAQAGVRQAKVVARAEGGDKRLVAYVVSDGRDISDLRRQLRSLLPESMVPAVIVELAQLPTLANGKIDQRALPAPQYESVRKQAVAARTDLERATFEVWREVLKVEQFGVTDSFFDLGGHSLLAMQMLTRLRGRLGIEIPLRAVFDAPSIETLALWIETQGKRTTSSMISRAPAGTSAPLTAAQRGMWFVDRLGGYSAQYNISSAIALRGALDVPALARVVKLLTARHDSLHSSIAESEGVPIQVFAPRTELALQQFDLSSIAPELREAALQEQLGAFGNTPFDLAQAPLARAALFRMGTDEHVLALVIHHIVCDGWSLAILLREIAAEYSAAQRALPSTWQPLPLSWRDVAHWEQARQSEGAFATSLGYWRERLEGFEPLRLPIEATARGSDEAVAIARTRIDEPLVKRIEALASEHNSTVFMVLLAVVKLLLLRRFGREDVAVGTPVAGRDRRELEPLVGLLLNTLVLRTIASDKLSFRKLLDDVRRGTIDAWGHQDLPFEQLVAELAPIREAGYQPFFDVLVNSFGDWNQSPEMSGLETRLVPPAAVQPKFPLTLYLQSQSGSIELGMVARRDRFSAAGLRELFDQYLILLEQVTNDPKLALCEYSLITPCARRLLPDPTVALAAPPFVSVPSRIVAWAASAPKQIAIRWGSRHFDYAELDCKSREMARILKQAGIGQGDVVGLSGPRCFGVVASMLATLRCGAVFLTLDPNLPASRRLAMLRTARARALCILGADHAVDGAGATQDAIRCLTFDVNLDALPAVQARSENDNFDTSIEPDDPAYVFFTSGSSGTPKAVLGRHHGLSHFIDWQRDRFQIDVNDRVSQLVGLSFDPLLRDVFLPLTSGATLCIPLERDLLDPIAWLEQESVSVVHTTPTVMQSWLQCSHDRASLASLRWLFVAGEPLTDSLIDAWRSGTSAKARIVNLYGPTETTMARCFHVIGDSPDVGVQPVGTALPHSQALVIGASGAICGIGEIGEIAIRTPLMSLGYIGQAEETRLRFRPNSWRNDADDRLYFTGDRGRYRADGALEILGRLDDQVKIRGVRVEPAEVMAVLARHPSLRQCTVLARVDDHDRPMLVAYLVAHEGAISDSAALRAFLAAQLPEAFVPSAYVWLDALPTLPNGKIDRKSLPAPSLQSASVERIVRPRDPIEQALWDVWHAVLSVDGFGVSESFFELGGHSLLATQVIARIRDKLGVELPLRSLFEAPTIAGLAAAVGRAKRALSANEPVAPLPAIRRQTRDHLLPTSYSQRRMWLLQEFNPDSAAYNMAFALRLRGSLNREAFIAALQQLIARHEAFRTTLVPIDGEPMQRIDSHLAAPVERVDLRGLPASERERAAASLIQQMNAVPYQLSKGPLHRMTLLQIDDRDHVFCWSIHHSIGDGRSMTILLRELADTYSALTRGQEPVLVPRLIDFADYAAWQRDAIRGKVLDGHLAYWRQALAGLEPLPLPTDRPRRQAHDGRGSRISQLIPPKTLARIKEFAAQKACTPFMALLACFQLTLARYCGVADVAVGTPMANRTHTASEHLVGALVNTVVVRTDLSGDLSFSGLLQRVRETTLEAFAHQELPFEALVDALDLPRSGASAPLVQVLFNVLDAPASGIEIDGIELDMFEFESGTGKFDLELSIEAEMFGHVQLAYSPSLFDASTAQRILASYLQVLEQVVEAPDTPLAEFDFVDAESRLLLKAWSDAPEAMTSPTSQGHNIHALIDQQSTRTPDNIAIRTSTGSLKYSELQRRSNQLARLLRSRGVGRGAIVGLCVERSLDMVIAQLAILKSGAAYVPLDPAYPQERLAAICEDAQMVLLITESEISTPHWPHHKCLLLDHDTTSIVAQSGAPLAADSGFDAGAQDPAYVIYTSGSTGKPKGVVVPHGAVLNFLASMAREPGLNASDTLVAVTTLSFDIAVLELLLPLSLGAQVILATRDEAADGRELRRLLETHSASVMQATPSTWRMLIEAGWSGSPSFKALIGGEALPSDLAAQLLARCAELWNMYGPTETTVWSTCWRVQQPEHGISIGRPIANTQIHVLDAQRRLCPIGVTGEIYIGGAGVALGYLNRPELTAERFIADPFSAVPETRLYRTGDRGRWRYDGRLEHQGRLDHQVKVRGHRIELGDIEAHLSKHAGIAHAVVIVREDQPGDARLVAYVRVHDKAPAAAELREHLRARLPEYMVPQHFVAIDVLPLLPNGKLNRQALPAPAETVPDARPADDAPKTRTEQAIAQVWEELLGVGQVRLSDNFFDLGGHSLLAMRAVAAIEKQLGLKLNPRRLVFESLAQLAGADEPIETQY